MFDGRWRHAVDRTTKPVGRTLVRMGVNADVLTIFGLAMSVATAFVVGSGHFVWGVVMLFPTGLPDLFDGPVAKASGRASVRGAFFDSVADRISDAFLFGGVAWYLSARHHGEMVLLPFAIVAMTSLISYQRAKAELLGLSARGGLMERAERFILLGVCFIAGAVSASAFVPALWVFFGLLSATAAGRFVNVWREAEGPPAARPAFGHVHSHALARSEAHAPADGSSRTLTRWRQGRVDSRWRAWREARAQRELTGLRGTPRRAAQPSGRWRARRAAVPSSRTGSIWRARRGARATTRSGRRPESRGV
jgi:CDP-diacylglycerol--glycerol-3-phosphate 3-phosphatidyltransferase